MVTRTRSLSYFLKERQSVAERILILFDIEKRCEVLGVLDPTTDEARHRDFNKMGSGNMEQSLAKYANRLLEKLEAVETPTREIYAVLKEKHEKLEKKHKDLREKYGLLKEKKTKLRIRKQAQLHKIKEQLRKKHHMLKAIEILLL